MSSSTDKTMVLQGHPPSYDKSVEQSETNRLVDQLRVMSLVGEKEDYENFKKKILHSMKKYAPQGCRCIAADYTAMKDHKTIKFTEFDLIVSMAIKDHDFDGITITKDTVSKKILFSWK
jgi:hypothetical protein